jgi:hypothetical protein
MYKLVDLTDCLVREFDDLDELDTFCQTVWKLQYLEQAIKLDKKLQDMYFEDFKVFDNKGMKIKITDGKNYLINISKQV